MASWNATLEPTETLKAYDCPILIKQNIEEKEYTVETGTACEHPKAKYYFTLKHWNLKNFSLTTKVTASKHFCKVLYQHNPQTIPCGRRP
jgi:hypothetical protein